MWRSNLENPTQFQDILPNYTNCINRNTYMTHTQTETYNERYLKTKYINYVTYYRVAKT